MQKLAHTPADPQRVIEHLRATLRQRENEQLVEAAGEIAAKKGQPIASNPYDKSTSPMLWLNWAVGWNNCHQRQRTRMVIAAARRACQSPTEGDLAQLRDALQLLDHAEHSVNEDIAFAEAR